MTLWLRTFGAVQLEQDGTPLGGAHSQRRRLALLAYLAASENGVVARERLIALLWPEKSEATGRHSLSQLLYALRKDLGHEVIRVDTTSVRLDHAALPSDVHAFDEAVRADRHADAAAEYRGPFLDAFHVDGAEELNRWIDEERERRTHLCARSLDRLADAAESARDWHRAGDWLRRRLALNPADARTTIRLMQALVEIRDREGALRVAHLHESLVRDHLESEPDPAVLRYADALRRMHVARAALPAPPADIAPARSDVDAVGDTAAKQESGRAAASGPPPRGTAVEVRPWFAFATILGLASVAMIAWAGTLSRASTADERQSAVVVIGDFAGPDPVLALAVREALRAELANARGVRLASDHGIRQLRELMRMSRDSALRPPALLALATRGGAHMAVSGSVLPIGGGAQIVLELLDPGSARVIRTFTERPSNAAATLQSVERIARSIGAAVSRIPPDTAVRPLPAVTTASLEALKNYAVARQTAALGSRREAVAPAERAVSHDSTFVLAHYFLGDLLWFIDQQTHSEAHLAKAFQLMSTVPRREQLIIRARYEQLARDQPDSALAYWQLLADASPGDVLAYEGRTWALRALGRHEEAAAAADTAMMLDPGSILPNVTNAMYSWLSVGDTSSALESARRLGPAYPAAMIEARFYAALFRDPAAALSWADSTVRAENRLWRRHLAQVAAGDVVAARVTLDSVVRIDAAAMAPNALLNQGWAELALRGDRVAAARHARAALDWTRRRDLSPPAIGRLAERVADLAARAGDEATVRATMALVSQRDQDRSLRTYGLVLRALDAALAYARADYAAAARLAGDARRGVYFSRSLTTIALLEADALRRAGQGAAADSLDRLVDTHQIVDGNFEVWAVLRSLVRLRRSAVSRSMQG